MLLVALGRGDGDVLGLDAAVVFGHLLRPGVIGTEALPDRGSGQAADGEFLRAIQECAAVDIAVHVAVKKVQQLLRKIGRFLSFHVELSPWCQFL